MLADKTPIVNLQCDAQFVELHDGNTSAVAWLLVAQDMGLSQDFGRFAESFGSVVVLRDRCHPNGEVWHPYLRADIVHADQLQSVIDPEQGNRSVRLALSVQGEPVYFNDASMFNGLDAAQPLSSVTAALRPLLDNQ